MKWQPPELEEKKATWEPPEISSQQTPNGLPQIENIPEPLTTLTPGSSNTPMISPQIKFGETMPPFSPPAPPMPIKEQISQVARPVLEMGGMTLGVIAGGGAGSVVPAVGTTIGATGGGIIGFATGKSAADLLDRSLGLKEPIQTPREAVAETAESIKSGAFLEAAGLGIAAPVVGTLKKLAGPVVVESEALMGKIIAKAKEMGIDLTAAEIAGTRGLSMLESLLDKLPWTANQVQRYRINQLKKLVDKRNMLIDEVGGAKDIERVGLEIQKQVDDFFRGKTNLLNKNLEMAKDSMLSKLGSKETNHELGQTIKDVADKKAIIYREAKNQKYKEFGNIVPDDVSVVPSETQKIAKEIKSELESASPQYRNNKLIENVSIEAREVNPEIEPLLANYPEGSPIRQQLIEQNRIRKTAKQLIADRTALSDLYQSEKNFITGEVSPTGRVYGKLKSATDADLEALANRTENPIIIDSFKIAREANIDYKNYMKSPVFKRIVKENPEAVVNAIFNPGNETEIIEFKKLYGDEVFGRAKKKFTNSFLRLESSEPITQDFIAKQFNKYGETLNSIYTPQELNYVKRIGKLIYNNELATNEVLSNPLLRGLIKQGKLASTVIDTLVKPGDTTTAAAIRRTIGEQGIKNVQLGFTGDFLSLNQDGNFMPQKFAKNFYKYGRKTLESWYPKNVVDAFEDLALVSSRMGAAEKLAGNPSGTAQNLIGYFGGMAMIRHPISGLTAIMSSRNLSGFYLSPGGTEFFLKGITTPLLSKDAVSLATKLFGIALSEKNREKKENE